MDDIHTCHNECQHPICVAVREAVAAEREACARHFDENTNRSYYGYHISSYIRSRGQNGL